jgi:2-amino-4-hydroxy-6-hydroxymethyldihydropteridine diphosphokinase
VERAYIGLGANLGDPRAAIETAIDAIAQLPHSHLAARSGHYGSAPVGYDDQPDFVNAVVAIDTSLGALDLLHALQAIEAAHGRVRSFRNAPRTLDLDLLLYGDRQIRGAELTVPHPRLHERAFVLLPLHEIAPDLDLPDIGPLAGRLDAVAGQRIERLHPPLRTVEALGAAAKKD